MLDTKFILLFSFKIEFIVRSHITNSIDTINQLYNELCDRIRRCLAFKKEKRCLSRIHSQTVNVLTLSSTLSILRYCSDSWGRKGRVGELRWDLGEQGTKRDA